MSDLGGVHSWSIGDVTLERVQYFDIGLDAASINLEDVVASTEWAGPWIDGDQPLVGQAFWVIRSSGQTIVVDPCGASDDFLRSGTEAITHQEAAFAALSAAGCEPTDVDYVVFTHLDGIGMAALRDGADGWVPAFPNADLLISSAEYDHVAAAPDAAMGAAAFAVLDDGGVVRPVETPHTIAPGVTLRLTGAHSPGHCCVDIESGGRRAVMIGHLAISPLHASAGVSGNHADSEAAWTVLDQLLRAASASGTVLSGSLWSAPGAATVVSCDPFVLKPYE